MYHRWITAVQVTTHNTIRPHTHYLMSTSIYTVSLQLAATTLLQQYCNSPGVMHMTHHQYYQSTVSGEKNRSCVIENLANFSRPTKFGQQKIFSYEFENTTYQRKSCAVIGRWLQFEISRPRNDALTIKLIEIYEVYWFLYYPGDPNYQNWVLSINMMMHIFHYWITGEGKHVNMSENGGGEFSLWQRISATVVISMVTPTLLDFSSFFFQSNHCQCFVIWGIVHFVVTHIRKIGP